jgi:16S rRNA (adenine1518-N6/adenine1519-N6)-dimethyltransferase
MVQARCAVAPLFTVGPGAFQPPPRVESAVVRLAPLPAAALQVRDRECFATLVRAAFGQRRKMLRNALRTLVPDVDGLLAHRHIEGTARPETLTVAQFIALANDIAALRRGEAGSGG